jgi:hypothetical protein
MAHQQHMNPWGEPTRNDSDKSSFVSSTSGGPLDKNSAFNSTVPLYPDHNSFHHSDSQNDFNHTFDFENYSKNELFSGFSDCSSLMNGGGYTQRDILNHTLSISSLQSLGSSNDSNSGPPPNYYNPSYTSRKQKKPNSLRLNSSVFQFTKHHERKRC